MANSKVELMAQSIINGMSSEKFTVQEAMEVATAVTLSVATVSEITGISTNGKMTLHIQQGTPDVLGLNTEDYDDFKSKVGGSHIVDSNETDPTVH